MVTESFDCTRSGADLRKAVKEGEGWRDAMSASLGKLELLARAMGSALPASAEHRKRGFGAYPTSAPLP